MPLSIEITRGEADIETVLQDVLALTKLNYKTCRYGDGKPITLKFADAIGEVLIRGLLKTPAATIHVLHLVLPGRRLSRPCRSAF
jgi:hypothetical protein